MKTLSTILFLTIFYPLTSVSQSISFGPEVGFNTVLLQKDDLGNEFRLGWNSGAAFNWSFTEYLSLRTGVYFSQRHKNYFGSDTSELNVFGFDLNDLGIPGADFNVYTKTSGVTSQYGIEIPIMASYDYKGFSIFAGPYMHFMVRAWTREKTETNIPFLQTFNIDSLDPTGFISFLFPPAYEEDFSESSSRKNLRTFDYGFKAGMSYEANGFRTSGYYTFGIPDYRVDRGADDLKNHHYFSFSVAYLIRIKKSGRSSFQ